MGLFFPCFDIQQTVFSKPNMMFLKSYMALFWYAINRFLCSWIACLGHSVDGIIPELFQPFCIDLLLFIPQTAARSPRISVNL